MLILSMRTNKHPNKHNKPIAICKSKLVNLSYYQTQFWLCPSILINFQINIVISQQVYWICIWVCILIL